MKRNAALEAACEANMRRLGLEVGHWPADAPIGSIDFGNVSYAIPAIHCYLKMVPREIQHHAPAYARASRSAAGLAGRVPAAKFMAMTGRTRQRTRGLVAGPARISTVLAGGDAGGAGLTRPAPGFSECGAGAAVV
jgi:hypothetical protein